MRFFRKRFLVFLASGLLWPTASAVAAPPAGPLGGPAPVVTVPGTALQLVKHRFGPTVRVRMDASGLNVRQIFGLSEAATGEDSGAKALSFARANADLLAPGAGFSVLETKSPTLRGSQGIVRRDIVRLGHTLHGFPVEGRVTTVTLDGAGRVIACATDGAPLMAPAALTPILDAVAAGAQAEARYRVRALSDNASLVMLPGPGRDAPTLLAWRVPTVAIALVAHFYVWVDAVSGAILKHGPMGPDQGLRTIPVHTDTAP